MVLEKTTTTTMFATTVMMIMLRVFCSVEGCVKRLRKRKSSEMTLARCLPRQTCTDQRASLILPRSYMWPVYKNLHPRHSPSHRSETRWCWYVWGVGYMRYLSVFAEQIILPPRAPSFVRRCCCRHHNRWRLNDGDLCVIQRLPVPTNGPSTGPLIGLLDRIPRRTPDARRD